MSGLEKENQLAEAAKKRFGDKIYDVEVKRERRVWAKIKAENVKEVIGVFKNEFGFEHMPMVTGLDSGENYEVI